MSDEEQTIEESPEAPIGEAQEATEAAPWPFPDLGAELAEEAPEPAKPSPSLNDYQKELKRRAKKRKALKKHSAELIVEMKMINIFGWDWQARHPEILDKLTKNGWHLTHSALGVGPGYATVGGVNVLMP